MKTFKNITKKIVNEIYQKLKTRWPVVTFDENVQPHFFFLITPPYSGSTAIAKLLSSSSRIMCLKENGEGQWLVPGLCEIDRWDPEKEINYESVKSVWLRVYQKEKELNSHVDVVIEKSPPNMMRLEQLSSQFSNYSLLVNNRNPYANCASILYRLHDPQNLSATKRKEVLVRLVKDWLTRSKKLRALITKHNIPLLTYEKFCENPASILQVLDLPDGVSDSININAEVKVKDYQVQAISNQNERQIKNLTSEDIRNISLILNTECELLRFFGYEVV